MEKSLIAINSSSIQITTEDGGEITKGEVEQGTKLKISNLSASIENGSVTISPALPHITTNEEITAKKVVFTITGIVNGETAATTTYTIDLKDIYKSSIVSIEELKTKANTYWGWDVLNYSTKSGVTLGNNEWQVFYVGKIDDTDTSEEDHIYLISKNYIENQYLPTVMKKAEGATEYTAITGAKPIATDGSNYKAKFSNYNDGNPNDGVISQYAGSTAIGEIGQKLNSKFYSYLATRTTSYNNIKAVAYMLDTITWKDFAGVQADYAIGGPSVELLFKAYNKYKGTSLGTRVNSPYGYDFIKKDGEMSSSSISNVIDIDSNSVNSPYIVSGSSNSSYWWIASPSSSSGQDLVSVYASGSIEHSYFSYDSLAFRPLICLNSKYTLEKTKDSNGKDAFNIVEK